MNDLQIIHTNQNSIESLQKKAQIIDLFIDQFQSEHTKRAYRSELNDFFAFCESRKLQVISILPTHVSIFLNQKTVKDASKNRCIAALKSFYKWLEVNEFTNRNPLKSVNTLKTGVSEPTLAFTDEEVKKTLQCTNIENLRGNCSRLMLFLLFHLGLRRSELVNIKLEDITVDRDVTILQVKGKGGKIRQIPLPENVHNEIKDTILRYKKISGLILENKDFIFQLYSKVSEKPISTSAVTRAVKKYAKMAGVDKRVSPHSCRATVISHLLEKNVSIRNVADMAGHSSIVTTRLYDKKRDGYTNSAVHHVEY